MMDPHDDWYSPPRCACFCCRHSLRGLQRVRWAPLRCTLLVHHHDLMCPTTTRIYRRGCLLPTPSWTQRVLQVLYRDSLTGCASDWLLTEQAHGGVRQV